MKWRRRKLVGSRCGKCPHSVYAHDQRAICGVTECICSDSAVKSPVPEKGTKGSTSDVGKNVRIKLVTQPCWYCGDASGTIDHNLPRSRGGTNDQRNLLPACSPCNAAKGSLTGDEFIKLCSERAWRRSLKWKKKHYNQSVKVAVYQANKAKNNHAPVS